MRRFALVLAVAAALTIAASSGAFAAAPLVNEHNQFTETFPDELCDMPRITTVSAVDNFKLYADGTFLDTSRFQVVFTAADSGKSIMISSAGQAAGLTIQSRTPMGRSPSSPPTRGCPRSYRSPVARPCRWTRAWSPSPPPFAHSVTTSSSSSRRPSPVSTAHTRTWRAASSCSARYWSRR